MILTPVWPSLPLHWLWWWQRKSLQIKCAHKPSFFSSCKQNWQSGYYYPEFPKKLNLWGDSLEQEFCWNNTNALLFVLQQHWGLGWSSLTILSWWHPCPGKAASGRMRSCPARVTQRLELKRFTQTTGSESKQWGLAQQPETKPGSDRFPSPAIPSFSHLYFVLRANFGFWQQNTESATWSLNLAALSTYSIFNKQHFILCFLQLLLLFTSMV